MSPKNLIVSSAPGKQNSKGLLRFGLQVFPCILGKNGITTRKQEGDMKTPSGTFQLLFSYHNKSRIPFISSNLPIRSTRQSDGWCDDPSNANYNRPVSLPTTASHEVLMRDDHLYDIIVVMDHNYTNRIKGRGSAVFFHLTDKKDYTAGCVAVSEKVMRYLLPKIDQNTQMIIKP